MTLRLIALPAIAMISFYAVVAPPEANDEATTTTSAPEPENDSTDREAMLVKRLTNAVLRGSFQMTNADGLEGKAPMTKPSVERYEISGISKLAGSQWVITARIQYADRDVLVPVPVRILWAAGTPIITLDKMKIPMIGEYSARVVIDDGFYGGTWRGATYGGVLSGQILKKDDVEKIEKMEAAGWSMTMPAKRNDKNESESSQRDGELKKDVHSRPQSRGTKSSPIDLTNTRAYLDLRRYDTQYVVIEGFAENPGKGLPLVRFQGRDPGDDNRVLVSLKNQSWPERALNRRVRVAGLVRTFEKVIRPDTEPAYQEYTEGYNALDVDHWELVAQPEN